MAKQPSLGDDKYLFVQIAGRMVWMPREYAALITEAVEAETRRCAAFIGQLTGPDGCVIPNRGYIVRKLLESAGLEPEPESEGS